MSRWNFKDHGNSNDLNNKYINANRPLDTNPDHYKSSYGNGIRRGRDEGVSDPSKDYDPVEEDYYSRHPKQNYQRNYVEGVAIHFVGGGVYKSKEFTAAAFTQLMKDRFEMDKSIGETTPPDWLDLKNGGMIRMDNITYFGPYKFYGSNYNREDY